MNLFQRIIIWLYKKYVVVPHWQGRMDNTVLYIKHDATEAAMRQKSIAGTLPYDGIYRTDH